MKVNVGQIVAADAAIGSILSVKRDKPIKAKLTYTLLSAQAVLGPHAEAFGKARQPLVLECFDTSKPKEENGQTVVPPKMKMVDGTEVVDLELALKFQTEIGELAEAEVELAIGQIPIDQLDSVEPAPSPQEIAGMMWLLKE